MISPEPLATMSVLIKVKRVQDYPLHCKAKKFTSNVIKMLNLEERIDTEHGGFLQRMKAGIATRVVGLTLAMAIPYLSGCSEPSCKTDADCYSNQVCIDLSRKYAVCVTSERINDKICVDKSETKTKAGIAPYYQSPCKTLSFM